MKKTFTKFLSVLLIFAMLFPIISVGVSASNSGYSLTLDPNGGSGASQKWRGKTYYEIHQMVNMQKENCILLGWSKDKNATSPEYFIGNYVSLTEDTTIYAVWAPAPTLRFINKPDTPTVLNYGDKLIITAEVSYIPEGTKLYWETNYPLNIYAEGNICQVTATDHYESIEVLAYFRYEKSGNDVLCNGKRISETQTVEFDSNIWTKIISFFKTIFGIDRFIYQ